MQNSRVKAQIMRNPCGLGLSESPDTVDVRPVCSLKITVSKKYRFLVYKRD
jgi:hypothetical protein